MKQIMRVLLCVMAMAPLANAGLVTYTVAFNDNYSGTFDISEVLSVPQFNSFYAHRVFLLCICPLLTGSGVSDTPFPRAGI